MSKPESYASVWDAIADTHEQAANLRARAELMQKIAARLKQHNWTQAEAANRCGVTQPRINDLLRGRVSPFSLDALVNIATALGCRVRLDLEPAGVGFSFWRQLAGPSRFSGSRRGMGWADHRVDFSLMWFRQRRIMGLIAYVWLASFPGPDFERLFPNKRAECRCPIWLSCPLRSLASVAGTAKQIAVGR